MNDTKAVRYEQEIPDVFKSMAAVHETMDTHGLDRTIHHLVQLRASQINSCGFCVKMHTNEAREDGGFTRYPAGQGPACCEVCPREAVIYGRREELLAEAHRRLADHPGRYHDDRVYGETRYRIMDRKGLGPSCGRRVLEGPG